MVRTLSPEEMDAFVHASGAKIRQEWEVLKEKYKNKTATPFEQMQVGGHYRTKMIFILLSQDVIEQDNGVFQDLDAALARLSQQICEMTGLEGDFVEFTMKDLIAKGYLRVDDIQGKTRVSWAHHSGNVPVSE
ncbi:MAG: hypothetical protein KKE12_08230 [Proteobacteria bacterium]|nr:hypothetical protein [Pseudomonadota bacterium]